MTATTTTENQDDWQLEPIHRHAEDATRLTRAKKVFANAILMHQQGLNEALAALEEMPATIKPEEFLKYDGAMLAALKAATQSSNDFSRELCEQSIRFPAVR
jgi:regulation of enolase protein 1 (concanavalin A-like superfamily)